MARTQKVLSVFVSSPSDVSEERAELRRIVSKINSGVGRSKGVMLELRGVEDVAPAFGSEPQEVVNKQIQDYDIFVGILWHRIGTPTKGALSGTIEEFQLAKARYDKDPKCVELMLYFKTAPPLSLSEIDPDQLRGVNEFRSRVSKEGGLYKEFASVNDFANQVDIHLTGLVVQEKGVESLQPSKDTGVETQPPICEDEDEGLLDLEDTYSEEMTALHDVLLRMDKAIRQVGDRIRQRSGEVTAITPPRDSPLNVRRSARVETRRIIKKSARDLDQFVAEFKIELPLYRKHLDTGIGALMRAVPIYLELPNGKERKDELKDVLAQLRNSMAGMLDSMEGFRDSTRYLPRMTSDFVRARKSTSRVLQESIDITKGARASLESVVTMLG